MRIYVSGSLAFDRIMNFPGRFADHILPDKIHILNVCFLVDGLEEKLGGTAGNIAYSLALLGEKPTILAAVGKDFGPYRERLQDLGLPLDGLHPVEEEFTAGAYITTDKDDNQITGFNPGAMKHPSGYRFKGCDPAGSVAVVSAGNVRDMTDYPRRYREMGLRFVFDPGQQITALTGEQMAGAMDGAMAVVSNDYELELIMKATGLDKDAILERCGAIITTLGDKGSVVVTKDGETRIPAAKALRSQDPTGAGDAYRAGLLKGLVHGKTLADAARMGATCASFCVEHYGTQSHHFTMEQFQERHAATFGGPA